jgi:uroporphyrinogen decarboxylase
MTPIERVTAVLTGDRPDRPPVSFWHHFSPDCQHGQAAVDAHLRHASRFGLDFLKVMNDNRYPVAREIRSPADLRDLPVLRGDEDGYGRQLDLIRALVAGLGGKLLMATTLFNAWAVLRRMATPAISDRHGPPKLSGPATDADRRMTELVTEDRAAVGMALNAIAASQANFAAKCIQAGADGIFLSVRDDWVNTDAHGPNTYDELVRGGDNRILAAAGGARFNMLHACGVPRDLGAFAEYQQVHAVNWADRAGGPAIREVIGKIKPAVCGGVDNLSTLPSGTPQDVEEEVRDALRQAGGRPMMISAGCTYDPDVVPEANLHAMVRAARGTE